MLRVYVHFAKNAGIPKRLASNEGGILVVLPSGVVYVYGIRMAKGMIDGQGAWLSSVSVLQVQSVCLSETKVDPADPQSAAIRLIWP